MIWILVSTTVLGMWLFNWSSDKCTELDIRTGRRDSMARHDDYGSNRGSYWPYSFLGVIGMMVGLGSLLILIIIVLEGLPLL